MGEIVIATLDAIRKSKKEEVDRLMSAMTMALMLVSAPPSLYESIYESTITRLQAL